MTLSEDVRDYLATKLGVSYIFYNVLPDSLALGAVILDSSGIANMFSLRSGIQIIVRAATLSSAHALAVSIWTSLHNNSYFLSNFIITNCVAQGDILPIGKDEKGRLQYSLNFILSRKSWKP